MKVLHVAEKAYGGGAESVFRETIQVFKKYDQEREHYVACKNSENLPFNVDFAFTSAKESIVSKIYSRRHKKELDFFLSELKPQLIHLQHYANLSSSILHSLYNYKSKNQHVKIVQTVHTFEYACSHHAAYDYKLSKRCLDCASQTFKTKIFYRNCSRLGFLHSLGKGLNSLISHYYYDKGIIDEIIVPSEFMKTAIELNTRYLNRNISIVSNPISEELFSSASRNKKNQIIYFGRLSEEKNLSVLIKGYNSYKKAVQEPFKLLIIGEGSEKEKLLNLSRELNCMDYIIFLPFLSQGNLKRHLEESKISLLTSKCFENAPMMVIESIASDIVPIVSNHGGMLEMVRNFDFGFTFQAEDYLNLADQMNYVAENYYNIITTKKELKENVKLSLSTSQFFREINKIYKIESNNSF